MMKTTNIGKRIRFHNRAHYPSLTGRLGTIVNDYHGDQDMGPYSFGILIDGETRSMAAAKSEVEFLATIKQTEVA